jgi:hypothetical protein
LLLSAILTNSLYGASSIQLEVGEFQDVSSAIVVTGTWLVILDLNDDGVLPGGLAAGPTSSGALTAGNAAAISSAFSGASLSLGVIDDDQIISVGNIGDIDLGDGYATSPVNFSDGQEGLAYGIYWVPGQNPGDTLPNTGNFQMGGYFTSTITEEFALRGMFAPPAPVSNEPAVFYVTSFNALLVAAVPEPSTLALTAFAALGLLRRRRA